MDWSALKIRSTASAPVLLPSTRSAMRSMVGSDAEGKGISQPFREADSIRRAEGEDGAHAPAGLGDHLVGEGNQKEQLPALFVGRASSESR